MLRDKTKEIAEKNIKTKLDSFLGNTKKDDCNTEECLINNPEEIVKRENKKIAILYDSNASMKMKIQAIAFIYFKKK